MPPALQKRLLLQCEHAGEIDRAAARQTCNLSKREAQLLERDHLMQPRDFVRPIDAPASRGARRLNETVAFIDTQGAHGQAERTGGLRGGAVGIRRTLQEGGRSFDLPCLKAGPWGRLKRKIGQHRKTAMNKQLVPTIDRTLGQRASMATLKFVLALAALIFLPAWTVNYWQGWLLWANISAWSAALTWHLLRHDPALLERRMAGPGAETERNGLTIATPGPGIEWRTTVEQYIGLDVSLKDTSISIRQEGQADLARDMPVRSEAARRSDPQAGARSKARGVRDRTVVGVVLSCADGGRVAGDLHRCASCQGCPGHGAQ